MIMSFKRGRAQLRCEEYLNCTGDLNKWFHSDFKNYTLSRGQANQLSYDLLEDATDLFFKGLLSLSEALNSTSRSYYSWATIKLYYSVYYFIKASLASKGIAMIRNKSLFYLFAREGAKPVKKSPKGYNSDHSGTIFHFQDLFPNDILLTNMIEDESVYIWLMHRREQVQYRERSFQEPNNPYFWYHIIEKIKQRNLDDLITEYINDKYILCFQEEHSCMAAPIKRIILTYNDLKNAGIKINLDDGQRKKIIELLTVNDKLLSIANALKL